jgi:hypothetical protein
MCTVANLASRALSLLVFLLVCLATAPVYAAEGFVLGDSIGEDMAVAVGLHGAAHHSVSLRRNAIGKQFPYLPKGAIALMSLGLNDAADPVEGMRKEIEVVIEEALRTGAKFVWIGPPCVLHRWDARAKQMDDYLRQRLASTTIQYVSLRDPQICQHGMRSGDGEHFTEAGYRYVWQKIRRDSTFAAEVETASSRRDSREPSVSLVRGSGEASAKRRKRTIRRYVESAD